MTVIRLGRLVAGRVVEVHLLEAFRHVASGEFAHPFHRLGPASARVAAYYPARA
ncbi:MAG: hypothetical protein K0U78_09995 [Actinomycetia bacterium]|nr:hypothetical protein [Actinomycetes bacterium]